MAQDPFGNLQDWRSALALLDELTQSGRLAECQPGLVRLLSFKGNWRLREETLKRLQQIQAPTDELIGQVLSILADDNVYYEARVLASSALAHLLKNGRGIVGGQFYSKAHRIIEKLRNTPQPSFFEKALKKCNQALL